MARADSIDHTLNQDGSVTTLSTPMMPPISKLTIEQLQNDINRPETQRRSELIARLVAQGKVIEKQEPGLVTVKTTGHKFSWILCFLLLLLWVLPGVIYILACAFSKGGNVSQYVIRH